jgi:hypothetical protein
MVDGLPLVLTVEEAGEVLRIGRTKAYAMAREWRDTGGLSGLPVIDLGHVLRVPRRALEQLLGGELTAPPTNGVSLNGDRGGAGPTPAANGERADSRDPARSRPSQVTHLSAPSEDQLGLFAAAPPTT